MVLGILFTLCGCVWLWTITYFNAARMQVIGPSVLIGIGGSVLIVTVLAMGTDLIGPHIVSSVLLIHRWFAAQRYYVHKTCF